MKNCFKIGTLLSLWLMILTVTASAGPESGEWRFLVRFENSVSRAQAEKKIQDAGGKLISVVSEERRTYQGEADTEARYNQVFKILSKDKQVVFIEKEQTYSLERKKK